MTGTRAFLEDLDELISRAVDQGKETARSARPRDEIIDELKIWFFRDAPGPGRENSGWFGARVRMPKTDYGSRARAMRALADAGFSLTFIGRLYRVNRTWVGRVVRRERSRS